jgi:hypothetical protein
VLLDAEDATHGQEERLEAATATSSIRRIDDADGRSLLGSAAHASHYFLARAVRRRLRFAVAVEALPASGAG